MCLYGHPDESWEVTLPAEEVPPELPEPALGINFARDGMNRKDWLSLIAVHSDAWLLSVAFYFGARLNRNERFVSLVLSLQLIFSRIQMLFLMFFSFSTCGDVIFLCFPVLIHSAKVCLSGIHDIS